MPLAPKALSKLKSKSSSESLDVTENVISLPSRQLTAIEALLNRGQNETLDQVAIRSGISPRTLFRYFKSEEFLREYQRRIKIELAGTKGRMAQALIRGGVTPGPSQVGFQKLYWQLVGDLRESLEISGPGGGPIETQNNSWLKYCTIEEQRTILEIADRAQQRMLEDKGGEGIGEEDPSSPIESNDKPIDVEYSEVEEEDNQ